MSDVVPCHIEWPGLNTYFEAYMTLGHGIQPGVCIVVCPAQDTPLSAFGTLVWRAGNLAISLPACRIDKIEGSIDPQRGRIWTITILDRRWQWRFGEIQGWWNVRESNMAIRRGTDRSVRDLAKMYLIAMGEKHYDVDELPDKVYPEVRIDPGQPPALALENLCEQMACRVVPWFIRGEFTGVKICKLGYGADLPKTNLEFHEGFDKAELPDQVGIRLAPTIIDVHLPLRAVISTDLFLGVTTPNEILFNHQPPEQFQRLQRFPSFEDRDIPAYNPERVPAPWSLWTELPPILRERMQMQVGGGWYWVPVQFAQDLPGALQPSAGLSASWTLEMQQRLRDEALRCYQVQVPFVVPGIKTVTQHDQYILESECADTIEDVRTGLIRRTPAYVYGSYCMDIDSESLRNYNNVEAEWGQLGSPVDPNAPLVYQGSFQIDVEQRVVKFQDHMVRNTCPPGRYVQRQGNILSERQRWVPQGFENQLNPNGPPLHRWEPAALVLVTAVRLLGANRDQDRYTKIIDVDTRPGRRHTNRRNLPRPENPMVDWKTFEELQLRGKVTYRAAAQEHPADGGVVEPWFEPVAVEWYNQDVCDTDMEYYLQTMMERYQTKVPQRAVYTGLYPIQMDGAIEQVTYSSSNGQGAYTVACRHSEWRFGFVVGYDQRRQLRELWNYRDIIASGDQARLADFRRLTYAPGSAGGVRGRRAAL